MPPDPTTPTQGPNENLPNAPSSNPEEQRRAAEDRITAANLNKLAALEQDLEDVAGLNDKDEKKLEVIASVRSELEGISDEEIKSHLESLGDVEVRRELESLKIDTELDKLDRLTDRIAKEAEKYVFKEKEKSFMENAKDTVLGVGKKIVDALSTGGGMVGAFFSNAYEWVSKNFNRLKFKMMGYMSENSFLGMFFNKEKIKEGVLKLDAVDWMQEVVDAHNTGRPKDAPDYIKFNDDFDDLYFSRLKMHIRSKQSTADLSPDVIRPDVESLIKDHTDKFIKENPGHAVSMSALRPMVDQEVRTATPMQNPPENTPDEDDKENENSEADEKDEANKTE